MTTYNSYPVKNNIILFYKKEFSQWHGGLSDGLVAPFKISHDKWSPFFKVWYDYDQYLSDFDTEEQPYEIKFNTAEQAMMFGKAIIFKDFDTARRILEAKHPSQQKALGRAVRNYNQEHWDQVKLHLVTMINFHKFSQNMELKKLLIETGQYILAEASPIDLVYGIGYSDREPNAGYVSLWKGQNILGRALMRVREQLQ
jgi:ribA/ribD-fused uncharacterized protein